MAVFRTLEEALQAIRDHEDATNSAFVIVKRRKSVAGIEKHRIFWEEPQKAGLHGSVLEYDGIPFIIRSSVILDCQFGPDHHRAEKKKLLQQSESHSRGDHVHMKRKFCVQNSLKHDCPAKAVIREICKFPQFKIERDSAKRRLLVAKKIRQAMTESENVTTDNYFIVKIPEENQHFNHLRGEAAGLSLPVDDRVKQFVVTQVEDGIFNSAEVRRHTESFVRRTLFNNKVAPSPLNRRYYPTRRDYINMIYATRTAQMRSCIDQENLHTKIEEWQSSQPNDKFFFRPYFEGQTQCAGNTCADDEDIIVRGCGQKGLLLVHQTAWQRRLLARYGHICLLDATYKTSKYALPLFFLCVRTNVDYIVVAEFVTQYEDSESIAEALDCIKCWNGQWTPKSFMVDCCEAEMKALGKVFEGCQVIICSFHREQAWLRWTSLTKHGVSTDRDSLLELMRNIANANTIAEYDEAVRKLQSSCMWNENKLLQAWFTGTWLSQHKRWVQAFRDQDFTISITTNNGLERQNRILKYDYLAGYRRSTLSGLTTVIVEKFLPDAYRNYVQHNVRFSAAYRTYQSDIPPFLHNRPLDFVQHVCARWQSASNFTVDNIAIVDDRTFLVSSSESGNQYHVYFGRDDTSTMPSCECYDWQKFHWPCKHFCLIFRLLDSHKWHHLSCCYRDSPYFSIDSDVVTSAGLVVVCDEPIDVGHSVDIAESNAMDPVTSAHSIARSCREVLKSMCDMTYLCTDVDIMTDLLHQLSDVAASFRGKLPQDNGLLLEMNQGLNRVNKNNRRSQLSMSKNPSSAMNRDDYENGMIESEPELVEPLLSLVQNATYTGSSSDAAVLSRQLSTEQLQRFVQSSKQYIWDMFHGQIPCERHTAYRNGGKDRRALISNLPLGLLSDEQFQVLFSAILDVFGAQQDKYSDYVLRVLTPEIIVKIVMDILHLSHDDAEEYLLKSWSSKFDEESVDMLQSLPTENEQQSEQLAAHSKSRTVTLCDAKKTGNVTVSEQPLRQSAQQSLKGKTSTGCKRKITYTKLYSIKKKIKFADSVGKPLVTIETFFKDANVNRANSENVESTGTAVDENLHCLLGVTTTVVKATKTNITSLLKRRSGGIMSCGNVTITEADLLTLLPNSLICDNILDAYLEILSLAVRSRINVLALPSQLATQWSVSMERDALKDYMYENVRLSTFQLVLIPVVLSNAREVCKEMVHARGYDEIRGEHWILLCANVHDQTVSILDSLRNVRSSAAKASQYVTFFQEYMALRSATVECHLREWKETIVNSGIQRDGFSCGVFVAMNADALCSGVDTSCLAQLHANQYRHVMFTRLKEHLHSNKCSAYACLLPRGLLDWSQCDNCFRWYHFQCQQINSAPESTWFCSYCIDAGRLQIVN